MAIVNVCSSFLADFFHLNPFFRTSGEERATQRISGSLGDFSQGRWGEASGEKAQALHDNESFISKSLAEWLPLHKVPAPVAVGYYGKR